jgi:hypothetical protein
VLACLAALAFGSVCGLIVLGGPRRLLIEQVQNLHLFTDFRLFYYPTGRDLFRTGLPVPGYFYTPLFALLLSGLAAFPLGVALLVWGLLQLAVLAGLLIVPAMAFGRKSRWYGWLYVALSVCSVPILHNLRWGQISVPLVFCVVSAMYLYHAEKRYAAAVLLGLAASIKYYPLAFGFYMLARKDYRCLAALVLATACLSAGLPALVLGPAGALRFYSAVNQNFQDAQGRLIVDPNSQYVVHAVGRLVWGHVPQGIAYRALEAAGYAICVANAALVWLLAGRNLPRRTEWAFCLIFLSIPFALKTSWPHDLAYLPFCQAFVLTQLSSGGRSRPGRWALAGLVLVSVVLSSPLLFPLLSRPHVASRGGYLFLADAVLLLAAYACVKGIARTAQASAAASAPTARPALTTGEPAACAPITASETPPLPKR